MSEGRFQSLKAAVISTGHVGPTTGYVCLTSGIELPVGTWTAGRYSSTLGKMLDSKESGDAGGLRR